MKKMFMLLLIVSFVFSLSGCKRKTLSECVEGDCFYPETSNIIMEIIEEIEEGQDSENLYYKYAISSSESWNHDDKEMTMKVSLKRSDVTLTEIIDDRDLFHTLHQAVIDDFTEYDGDFSVTVRTTFSSTDGSSSNTMSTNSYKYRIVTNPEQSTTIEVDLFMFDNAYNQYINSHMSRINEILKFSEEGNNVIVSIYMRTLGVEVIQLSLNANSELVTFEFIDLDENANPIITDNIQNLFLYGLNDNYTLLLE